MSRSSKFSQVLWSCTGCPTSAVVSLYLFRESDVSSPDLIAWNIAANKNVYNWKVPNSQHPASDYFIRLNVSSSSTTSASTLTSATTPRSTSVLSPVASPESSENTGEMPTFPPRLRGTPHVTSPYNRRGLSEIRSGASVLASADSGLFRVREKSGDSWSAAKTLEIIAIVMAGLVVIMLAFVAAKKSKNEETDSYFDMKRLEDSGVSTHPLLEVIPWLTCVDFLASHSLFLQGALSSMVSTPSDWVLDMRNLKLGKMIGVGSSAHVFEAKYFGQLVAAKRLPALSMDPVEVEAFMRKEAGVFSGSFLPNQCSFLCSHTGILVHLHHPSIIKFYGIGLEGDYIYLVTELCRGSIRSLIEQANQSRKFIPVTRLFEFAIGIARGVEYLHSRDTIHRDIKPDNVLLTDKHEVKLCDFGISRM